MNIKWKKGEDMDILNLTFVLQVNYYFVMGTFFLSLEKRLSSKKV